MQDFRHLKCWQRAHAMAIELHKLTARFGRLGHGNLRSQLTRAAESIAANIAEGCGAASKKDFARFLDSSIKSANETEAHLLSARDFELFSRDIWLKYATETVEIRKMVYVYRRKVLESDRGEH